MAKTQIILVDNGSLEAESTLQCRRLAHEVSKLINQEVKAVSVLHSHKIDPARLQNIPAKIFAEEVKEVSQSDISQLIVLPLFIGPSRAITEYIPEQFQIHARRNLQLKIAPTLYGADGRLRKILIDQLFETGWQSSAGTVYLCDHGSPAPEVTAVRDALAREIREELRLSPSQLIACSMERREGPEYAFNEPLLESVLPQAQGKATILMQFLLPGRHAGLGGDVEEICKKFAPPNLKWKRSKLISGHPALATLIAQRYREVNAA